VGVLLVAALEEETTALPAGVEVVHLGVGKVQAAATLAGVLAARDDVELVVDLGTAGGLQGQNIGEVVEIARVHQHDLDHAGIEALVGRPLPGGPIGLDGPPGATARLATGDRLVADEASRRRLAEDAEVVDMEGYAVAAVCRAFGVPVWIVKAVSDGAGDGAVTSWQGALARCAEALAAWVASHDLA
jgi:adenosylhomocysteine nucleosidase